MASLPIAPLPELTNTSPGHSFLGTLGARLGGKLGLAPHTLADRLPGASYAELEPQTPTAVRQGQRLTPQFAALREALTASRAQVADGTAEPDPELVVIFDVAGTVDRF